MLLPENFNLRVGAIVVFVLGGTPAIHAQAPPGIRVETQDVTLLNPPGESGLGASVEWDEPYLTVLSTQEREVSLYKRGTQGWTFLDSFEVPFSGPGSAVGPDVLTLRDWCFVPQAGFGDIPLDFARGRVFVLRRVGERLMRVDTLAPPLLPLDPDNPLVNFSFFGGDMAADGDWLAIGAERRNGFRGAMFVYKLVMNEWILHQEIRSTIPGSGFFGIGVQLRASGYMVIGQQGYLDPAEYVHSYRLTGDQWILDGIVENPNSTSQGDQQLDDAFGEVLDLSPDGQTLAVTDPHGCNDDFLGPPVLGEVHVFERDLSKLAATWELVATLMPSNNYIPTPCSTASVGAGFGAFNVLLDGDALYVAGFRAYGLVDGEQDGAVYRFERGPQGLWGPEESVRFVGEVEEGQVILGGAALVGTSLDFDGASLFSGATIGNSGLRIFELNSGATLCEFASSSPSLEVLRPTDSDQITIALHDLPQAAPVQLVGSLTYSSLPGSGMVGELCLGGELRRVGKVQFAGPSGDLYLGPIESGRLQDQFSVLSGTSIGLQAWYPDPMGSIGFSDATVFVFD